MGVCTGGCGCFCCCCPTKKAKGVIPDGGIDAERGCTDLCCLLLFIVFVAGWLVIAFVAFRTGDPIRLIKPDDYEGRVCGIDPGLEDKPNLYIPSLLVSNLDFGVCVEECPKIGSVICKYDAQNETDDTSVLEALIWNSDCWVVFYESSPTLWRCFPDVLDPQGWGNWTATAKELSELVDTLAFGRYIKQGFAEIYDGRWVIFMTGITAVIITFIWILLIRFLVKPIVFLTIILILVLLVVVGFVAWWAANRQEREAATGDPEAGKQETTYRVFAWIFWVTAVIYLILLVWLLGRIRIAVEIIKSSSKALIRAWTLILIPPITFGLLIVITIWWVAVSAYIGSMGEVTEETFQPPENDFVNTQRAFPYEVFQRDNITFYLQVYNLFGYFWTMNFFLALGYFTICSTIVQWYFSEPTGSETHKHVGLCVVCTAFHRAIRYHLGSLLFGSLIIAIVQTIRFLLNYFAKKFEVWRLGMTAKIVLACMNCCLMCLERIINFINKNAYIVIAIRGTNFCAAAAEALRLLVSNFLRVATTSFISTFILFLCKVLIVATNLIVADKLLESSIPTDPIASGLFPLFVITVISWVIATMFMNLYDDVIDTVLLCFFMDDDQDREVHYMPKALAQLVDKYAKIEKMRRDAEALMMRKAEDVENYSGPDVKTSAAKHSGMGSGTRASAVVAPLPPEPQHAAPPATRFAPTEAPPPPSDQMNVQSVTSEPQT